MAARPRTTRSHRRNFLLLNQAVREGGLSVVFSIFMVRISVREKGRSGIRCWTGRGLFAVRETSATEEKYASPFPARPQWFPIACKDMPSATSDPTEAPLDSDLSDFALPFIGSTSCKYWKSGHSLETGDAPDRQCNNLARSRNNVSDSFSRLRQHRFGRRR